MTKPKHSALYRHIATVQGMEAWGHILDAGSGVNSMRWMQDLSTSQITAVTGSKSEAARIERALKRPLRSSDRLIIGNWADPDLLKSEEFDVVVADYLLGAIEGFAPYFQPYLFKRLRPHVGRALYVTGLEPYVSSPRPETASKRLLWEIGRFRDSCLQLSGHLAYREFPSEWVVDHLRGSGLHVFDLRSFKIAYKQKFVNAQIDLAHRALKYCSNPELVPTLKTYGERLRAEALSMIEKEGALRGCRNAARLPQLCHFCEALRT